MKKLLSNKNVGFSCEKKVQLAHLQPLPALTPASKSISSFMKSKFSERNRHQSKLLRIQIEDPKRESCERQQSLDKHRALASLSSQCGQIDFRTLDFDHRQKKMWLQKKESAASTSIRVESNSNLSSQTNELKVPRRLRRGRGLFADKNTFSLKEKQTEQPSELFILPRPKPKLIQHASLYEEQIDNKRKKFDSQFVTKKSIVMPNQEVQAENRSESQVTEEICRMQNSKLNNGLEDTLERGLEGNQPPLGDSGTLYESLYQQ